jgi:hypothetical protein
MALKSTSGTLADCGRMANTPAYAVHLAKFFTFMLFTFFKMAPAILGSSILDSPLPSTSQSPACAIFHKPVSAESL